MSIQQLLYLSYRSSLVGFVLILLAPLISRVAVPLSPWVATVVFFHSVMWILATISSKAMTDWAGFDAKLRKQVAASLVVHFLLLGCSATVVGVLVRIEQDRRTRLSNEHTETELPTATFKKESDNRAE